MSKMKALDIFLLCLKILLPVFIVIPLVFFSYRLAEGRIYDLANQGTVGYHSGLGLYIFASHIVLLGANVILSVIGAVGWLTVKKYKACPIQKKHVLTFKCLSLAPLCSQIFYVLITMVIINIG